MGRKRGCFSRWLPADLNYACQLSAPVPPLQGVIHLTLEPRAALRLPWLSSFGLSARVERLTVLVIPSFLKWPDNLDFLNECDVTWGGRGRLGDMSPNYKAVTCRRTKGFGRQKLVRATFSVNI